MDVEPGSESPIKRPRSAILTWLRVSNVATILAIATLLIVSSITSSPKLEIPGSVLELDTNSTAQTDTRQQDWFRAREVREEVYDKRAEKGRWLFCLMNMRATQVTSQNPWMDFRSIEDHGWEFVPVPFDDQARFDRVSNQRMHS